MMVIVPRIAAVSHPFATPLTYGTMCADNPRAASLLVYTVALQIARHKSWDSGLKVAPRANPG